MQDRHSVVTASVEKLVKLGLSDEEIIHNLVEVGISEQEAWQVLREVKKIPAKTIPPLPEEKVTSDVVSDFDEEPLPSEEDDLSILKEIVSEEEEKPKVVQESQQFASPAERIVSKVHKRHSSFLPSRHSPRAASISTSAEHPNTAVGMAEVWEKGILQTVNERLQEMKQLREDLDGVVEQKVHAAVAVESKKWEVLIKSQQALVLAKVSAELNSRAREVTEILDAKIAELKRASDLQVKASYSVDLKNELIKAALDKVAVELNALQAQRKQLLEGFSADATKSKLEWNVLLEESKKKLASLDERATQTLELQSAIIDGMVRESQGRIDLVVSEKLDDLTKEVRDSLAELQQLKQSVNPKQLSQEVAKLEMVLDSLDPRLEKALKAFSDRLEEQVEKQLNQRLQELDVQYQEIVKSVGTEVLQKEVAELESLKAELRRELNRLHRQQPLT